MKQIEPARALIGRVWTALQNTWPTVLAGAVLIQLVSYVLGQIVGMIPVVGMYLGILVTPVVAIPTAGLISGVLGYLRGKPLTIDCMTSMFPHWSRVILLFLWEMLCLMGWMLLSMLISIIVSVVLVLMGADMENGVAALWMMLVTLVPMLVLVLRAALSYSMSQCILIDAPATGVRDVLKQSKAMMRGFRWHYVKVSLPGMLIALLGAAIIDLLMPGLPLWLSSLISSALACVTGLYSHYCLPVMYEELRQIGR